MKTCEASFCNLMENKRNGAIRTRGSAGLFLPTKRTYKKLSSAGLEDPRACARVCLCFVLLCVCASVKTYKYVHVSICDVRAKEERACSYLCGLYIVHVKVATWWRIGLSVSVSVLLYKCVLCVCACACACVCVCVCIFLQWRLTTGN